MSNWLFKKLAPYAIRFREWSKDKIWIQILLGIFIKYIGDYFFKKKINLF